MNLKVLVAAPLVAYLVLANAADLRPPSNWSWSASGDNSPSYTMGVDEQVLYQGHRSLTVRSLTTQNDVSYVNAMQYVSAKGYEGKKVRFSGMLRSTGVDQWAGIWMHSDTQGRDLGDALPLADGATRSIPQWTPFSVVIEVGKADSQITMALGLVGNGQAWLSDLKFELVDDTTPVTATRAVMNLDKRRAWQAERRSRASKGPDRAMPQNLELSME